MSQRTLMRPLRIAGPSKHLAPQWTCRRCLATQTESGSSTSPIVLSKQDPRSIPGYDPTLPASKRIGPDGKPYRLSKTDFNLKKPLQQQRIPIAYLQHSKSEVLHTKEKEQRENTEPHKRIVGVVVSAGKMHKTVKVRVAGQKWNRRIKKYFNDHRDHLVSDPNSSLVAGDVVELHRLRVSRRVAHVVASIISPFGTPVDQRPAVPSADDRLAEYKAKRFAKLKRRTLRVKAASGDAEAIQQLESMGLNPGDGAAPGVGKSKKDHVQSQVGKSRNPGPSAILGEKGQKLPAGVLPGGKHEVGKIDDRAKQNKEKAMKRNEQTEDNLLEAKDKEENLQEQGLRADSVLS